MKKNIIFLFLFFSAFPAKCQLVLNSYEMSIFYNYPNCVTHNGTSYVLDTLCPDLLNVANVHLCDMELYDSLSYIRFFRNARKIDIGLRNIYPKDSMFAMLPHLEELYFSECAFHSDMPLYLPASLKKFSLFLGGSDMYIPALPNGLKEFSLVVSDTASIRNIVSSIPDSLEKFTYTYSGVNEHSYPDFLNFENKINLKSVSLVGYGSGREVYFPDFRSSLNLVQLKFEGYNFDTIRNLPNTICEFYFQSDSTLYIETFPSALQKLTFHTQIDCIPELPLTLTELYMNTSCCFPNYIPGLGVENWLCSTPGNNLSGCEVQNTIRGMVYRDLNNNCSYDPNTDLQLNGIPVNLFDSNDNFLATSYSLNGAYGFSVEDGSYKIVLDTLEAGLRTSCVGQAYEYTQTLGAGITESVHDFELKCDTLSIEELNGVDLDLVQIHQSNTFFPGQASDLCFYSANSLYNEQLACLSADNLLDSTLHFELRITGPVSFADTSSAFESQVINDTLVVSYDYTIESLFSGYDFCLGLQTDTTAQLGDEVCVQATVSLPGGELDLLSRCFLVVNSYDPNMKETYPMELAPGFDDEIRYTIHFQNTGNAAAINIQLVDTLDEKLAPETFRVIHASHDVLPLLNGNRLIFKFNNINLADSLSDPEGSKGYVEYAIRPRNPMQLDETIFNTAHIFFDFNEAIVTNTTENRCTMDELNIDQLAPKPEFVLYPNPLGTERLLKIRTKPTGLLRVSFLDLNGSEVGQYDLPALQNELDLKALKSGVYILKFETASGVHLGKLVLL